ncbi:MAG: CPXCG motif-containing cysteine-rich protein [Proteobacteria bacterium]|nr:CPXCG motif-containing cysteine-rich protein [Pseudomonadota bacterium]
MILSQIVRCPYCGERFASNIDVSAGSADYFEDCQVCCRPVRLNTEIGPDGELLQVMISRDDE